MRQFVRAVWGRETSFHEKFQNTRVPISEIAQSFLKFLRDEKNRKCNVWRALAGSQQLDNSSDFESELAYSKDRKGKKNEGG